MSILQRFFRRDHYRSELSQFIDQLKVDSPDLEARQLAGRAIWWDKTVDRQADRALAEGRVAQKAYVYGNGGDNGS